jgi:hypothetical protein
MMNKIDIISEVFFEKNLNRWKSLMNPTKRWIVLQEKGKHHVQIKLNG